MAKTVGIGIQNFEEVIERNNFYIDKTSFIKEWWESGDSVPLIIRPNKDKILDYIDLYIELAEAVG